MFKSIKRTKVKFVFKAEFNNISALLIFTVEVPKEFNQGFWTFAKLMQLIFLK